MAVLGPAVATKVFFFVISNLLRWLIKFRVRIGRELEKKSESDQAADYMLRFLVPTRKPSPSLFLGLSTVFLRWKSVQDNVRGKGRLSRCLLLCFIAGDC